MCQVSILARYSSSDRIGPPLYKPAGNDIVTAFHHACKVAAKAMVGMNLMYLCGMLSLIRVIRTADSYVKTSFRNISVAIAIDRFAFQRNIMHRLFNACFRGTFQSHSSVLSHIVQVSIPKADWK